jgi:aspartate racemase
MTEGDGREVLGILGGMGPLSSAEFLKTIYECTLGDQEQDSPTVVMLSEPAFPDRTTAFLAGEDDSVLEMLVPALQRLRDAGATRIVMCCMTVHHLLPRVPQELRDRVVSMPRLLTELLLEGRGRYLLVSSSGTRAFRLLEREPLWEQVRDRVALASDEDQAVIHRDLIYPMKRPCDLDAQVALLGRMLDRYGADGFVVGCSEVHILAKHARATGRTWSCIDGFRHIAEGLAAAPAAGAPAGGGAAGDGAPL